jgi:peptidoglycan/xylan/chitin deacetylase (PgdA/CDA1 family)
LDGAGLTATFFVEAINCELYPDALREIASRGHELGMHGWRHEMWAGLSRERERETVARAMGAFVGLGFEPRGFRPPGGDLTAASLGLLRDAGVTWCSPAGGAFGVRDGLTWVPFDWELVDAYYLMERFSRLRAIRGDAFEPLSAGQLAPRMSSGLRVVAESGGRGTLILHPFLMLDAEWWRAVRELLSEIAALSRDRGLWVGPGGALTGDPRAL